MEHSSRHLRFKLQSLSRRLDDLEEATRNLQKAEDEVLDLQDKIIQAEGSNSSMLADVEALRKRVLKIEGKDEEVKKAEELCRQLKEKLENEENVTRECRSEIEQLQKRMAELEKLEEAFSKSKNDCTQLCLSLNEEKNMSKKLSSELEILRNRVKELEASESKLDKAEQHLISELEKIRSLTVHFVNERKCFLEKEKQNEKIIMDLKEQLELKGKINTGDQTRNESNILDRASDHHVDRNNLRIEDNLHSKLSQRVGLDFIKLSENQTSSKNENEKNKNQEDNKIKDLHQEIEKLKNQVKQYEGLDEELKQLKEKNIELQENSLSEQSKTKKLNDEIETLKRQSNQHEVENGVLDSSEDLGFHSRYKNERTKYKGGSSEHTISKYTSRDESPQQMRSERHRQREYQNSDSHFKRQLSNSKKSGRSSVLDTTTSSVKKPEDKMPVSSYIIGPRDFGSVPNESKKSKDQPSVLSRYPPAAQEQTNQKGWKGSTGKKNDRSAKLFGEDYSIKLQLQPVENSTKPEMSDEKEIKECPNDVNSEAKDTSLPEEIILTENFSSLSMPNTEITNCRPEENTTLGLSSSKNLEDQSKITVNTEEKDIKDTTSQGMSSRYSRFSGNQDSMIDSSLTEQTTKLTISSNHETDPLSKSFSESKKLSYGRDKTRFRPSSKPIIPEKPTVFETTQQKEVEKRSIGFSTKRQSSPKEKSRFRGDNRLSNYENDNPILQREWVSEKPRKVSTDSLENLETSSHIEIRTRSCSPREALQSTVIIKPVIIEKDMKEVMSSYRPRSSSELNKSQTNPVPNKVMSSITIYPSETTSSRSSIEEAPKERHTSTSNIRLSANEQPLLTNNISLPFEISINKKDMSLKIADKDDCIDIISDTSTVSNTSIIKENNDIEIGSLNWKSHDIVEQNNLDGKGGRSWRRSVMGSTEELDLLTDRKDISIDNKYRSKSFFDDDRPVRLRTREQYSRKTSAYTNSWTPPEVISRRAQSSLTATEIISRRSNLYEPSSTSGLISRYRHSLQDDTDDLLSSRRKYSSEKLTKTDPVGKKTSSRLELKQEQRHQKGMVEERIRQLQH
ncbi:leucine zipper protein 1 [Discoglossus pictus]